MGARVPAAKAPSPGYPEPDAWLTSDLRRPSRRSSHPDNGEALKPGDPHRSRGWSHAGTRSVRHRAGRGPSARAAVPSAPRQSRQVPRPWTPKSYHLIGLSRGEADPPPPHQTAFPKELSQTLETKDNTKTTAQTAPSHLPPGLGQTREGLAEGGPGSATGPREKFHQSCTLPFPQWLTPVPVRVPRPLPSPLPTGPPGRSFPREPRPSAKGPRHRGAPPGRGPGAALRQQDPTCREPRS